MSEPQHVEISRLERESHCVQPGSAREAAALDRIDELREDELERLSDTQAAREKRHRRYWRSSARV
jgi:hypothetical protein